MIGFYKDDPIAKKKAEAKVADADKRLAALDERVKQLYTELGGLSSTGQSSRARSMTVAADAPEGGAFRICFFKLFSLLTFRQNWKRCVSDVPSLITRRKTTLNCLFRPAIC